MEYLTEEESHQYNNSPEVNHVIWNMREYEGTSSNCFANNMEDSIIATRRSYQIVFEPFAVYQEPILHEPGGDSYWFCRIHLYTRK